MNIEELYSLYSKNYLVHTDTRTIRPNSIFFSLKGDNFNGNAFAKKAIELRYKLLPYNYTLVFENNQSGKPLMRPLFFEEPENYKMYTVSNTYLWGDSFLVSPILNPGVTTKEVIFPATNKSTSNLFNVVILRSFNCPDNSGCKIE